MKYIKSFTFFTTVFIGIFIIGINAGMYPEISIHQIILLTISWLGVSLVWHPIVNGRVDITPGAYVTTGTIIAMISLYPRVDYQFKSKLIFVISLHTIIHGLLFMYVNKTLRCRDKQLDDDPQEEYIESSDDFYRPDPSTNI